MLPVLKVPDMMYSRLHANASLNTCAFRRDRCSMFKREWALPLAERQPGGLHLIGQANTADSQRPVLGGFRHYPRGCVSLSWRAGDNVGMQRLRTSASVVTQVTADRLSWRLHLSKRTSLRHRLSQYRAGILWRSTSRHCGNATCRSLSTAARGQYRASSA